MKITPKQLSEFFKAKNANDKCLYCGASEWLIPAKDEGDVQENEVMNVLEAQFQYWDAESNKRAGIESRILTIFCQNCGSLRLTHVHPISEYLSDTKGKP